MSDIHFDWTEDMSVGESTIDAQHQRLLSQLNKVIDAMVFGEASKEVAEALKFFEQYINEHLAYEEDYMQRRGYRDIDEHKKKHQDFRDKYADFKKKLDAGTTPESVLVEIEGFLGEWWLEHIGHEDRKYYLALGGVQ
jgi:hemerythrin-like metal-binding protein